MFHCLVLAKPLDTIFSKYVRVFCHIVPQYASFFFYKPAPLSKGVQSTNRNIDWSRNGLKWMSEALEDVVEREEHNYLAMLSLKRSELAGILLYKSLFRKGRRESSCGAQVLCAQNFTAAWARHGLIRIHWNSSFPAK